MTKDSRNYIVCVTVLLSLILQIFALNTKDNASEHRLDRTDTSGKDKFIFDILFGLNNLFYHDYYYDDDYPSPGPTTTTTTTTTTLSIDLTPFRQALETCNNDYYNARQQGYDSCVNNLNKLTQDELWKVEREAEKIRQDVATLCAGEIQTMQNNNQNYCTQTIKNEEAEITRKLNEAKNFIITNERKKCNDEKNDQVNTFTNLCKHEQEQIVNVHCAANITNIQQVTVDTCKEGKTDIEIEQIKKCHDDKMNIVFEEEKKCDQQLKTALENEREKCENEKKKLREDTSDENIKDTFNDLEEVDPKDIEDCAVNKEKLAKCENKVLERMKESKVMVNIRWNKKTESNQIDWDCQPEVDKMTKKLDDCNKQLKYETDKFTKKCNSDSVLTRRCKPHTDVIEETCRKEFEKIRRDNCTSDGRVVGRMKCKCKKETDAEELALRRKCDALVADKEAEINKIIQDGADCKLPMKTPEECENEKVKLAETLKEKYDINVLDLLYTLENLTDDSEAMCNADKMAIRKNCGSHGKESDRNCRKMLNEIRQNDKKMCKELMKENHEELEARCGRLLELHAKTCGTMPISCADVLHKVKLESMRKCISEKKMLTTQETLDCSKLLENAGCNKNKRCKRHDDILGYCEAIREKGVIVTRKLCENRIKSLTNELNLRCNKEKQTYLAYSTITNCQNELANITAKLRDKCEQTKYTICDVSKHRSIILYNLLENHGETVDDLTRIILGLFKQLNVNIMSADLEILYRLGTYRSDANRPVLVKFWSVRDRRLVMERYLKYKQKKKSDNNWPMLVNGGSDPCSAEQHY